MRSLYITYLLTVNWYTVISKLSVCVSLLYEQYF